MPPKRRSTASTPSASLTPSAICTSSATTATLTSPPRLLAERLAQARQQYEALHSAGATATLEAHLAPGPEQRERHARLLDEQRALLEELALSYADEQDEDLLRHAAQLLSLLRLLASLGAAAAV